MGAVDDLLAAVGERGLKVVVGDDGVPKVVGPPEKRTGKMMEALRRFRSAIIEKLRPGTQPAPAPPEPEKLAKPVRVEWQLPTGGVLTTFLSRPPGAAELPKRLTRPSIPHLCEWWRLGPHDAWRPIGTLPAEWGLKPLVETQAEGSDEEDEG